MGIEAPNGIPLAGGFRGQTNIDGSITIMDRDGAGQMKLSYQEAELITSDLWAFLHKLETGHFERDSRPYFVTMPEYIKTIPEDQEGVFLKQLQATVHALPSTEITLATLKMGEPTDDCELRCRDIGEAMAIESALRTLAHHAPPIMREINDTEKQALRKKFRTKTGTRQLEMEGESGAAE